MLSGHQWYLLDHFNNMNIVEYLNILSFELKERKEREKRLEQAAAMSKNSAAPYQTALLQEILRRL